MTNVTIIHSEGGTRRVIEIDGLLYPPYPGIERRVRKLPNMTAREDDVLICAYPRSGTNWVQEIVWMLRTHSTKMKSFTNSDFSIVNAEGDTLDALPSPRILNTHLGPVRIPIDFYKKNCKIIQVRRNPKDVLVSCYHIGKELQFFTGGNFKGAFSQLMDLRADVYGNWSDHIKNWEQKFKTLDSNNYLILHYEDMKQDLLSHVIKLADFLGWSRSEDFCRDVAEHCSFKAMKDGKIKVDGKAIMYRKGEVGDWKNWFSVAQNEAFDAEYKRAMKGYEYLKVTFEI